ELAEEEAGEGSVGGHGLVFTEARCSEGGEEVLDHLEVAQWWAQPRGGRVTSGHEREDLRMSEGKVPHGVSHVLQIGLPPAVRTDVHVRRTFYLLVVLLHDRLEEVLTAVDVAVESHRFHAHGRT